MERKAGVSIWYGSSANKGLLLIVQQSYKSELILRK